MALAKIVIYRKVFQYFDHAKDFSPRFRYIYSPSFGKCLNAFRFMKYLSLKHVSSRIEKDKSARRMFKY